MFTDFNIFEEWNFCLKLYIINLLYTTCTILLYSFQNYVSQASGKKPKDSLTLTTTKQRENIVVAL